MCGTSKDPPGLVDKEIVVFVTALSGYRHARWLCQHNTAPDVCVCRARASKLQQAQTQRDRSPAPGVRLWRVCADTAHSLGTPHRGLARAHTCMFRCTHRKGHTETWSGHRVSRPTVRRFAHVSLPGRWAHHLVWCVRQYKGHSTHVATEPSTTTEQATRALGNMGTPSTELVVCPPENHGDMVRPGCAQA